jgi:fructokinase
MIKTLCIGEILWDIFPDKKVWGGAPANFIFHTAQFGADAHAVTAIGDDELGHELIDSVEKTGINLQYSMLNKPTGVVNITLDKDGSANYTFNKDCAWDHIPFTAELERLSSQADLLCFGSLAQRSIVSEESIFKSLASRKATAKVLFDINLRQQFYTKEIIHKSLMQADFLKLNEDEEIILKKMFGKDLEDLQSDYNLELIILTLGADGSRIMKKGDFFDCPAAPCKIIDTVGAGDSFTACFIINYLNGVDIAPAQKLASRVASYVCEHKGATVEIPEILKPNLKQKSGVNQ